MTIDNTRKYYLMGVEGFMDKPDFLMVGKSNSHKPTWSTEDKKIGIDIKFAGELNNDKEYLETIVKNNGENKARWSLNTLLKYFSMALKNGENFIAFTYEEAVAVRDHFLEDYIDFISLYIVYYSEEEDRIWLA